MKPPSVTYSESRQLRWRSTWLFVKSAAYAPDHPVLSKRLQRRLEPASNHLHFLAMSSCWPSRYGTLKVMWGWVIESWFLPLSVLYGTLIAPYIFHPNLIMARQSDHDHGNKIVIWTWKFNISRCCWVPTNYATRNNLQCASLNKYELSNASGSSLVHHMKLKYKGKSEKQPNKQTTLKMTTKPKKQYSEKWISFKN